MPQALSVERTAKHRQHFQPHPVQQQQAACTSRGDTAPPQLAHCCKDVNRITKSLPASALFQSHCGRQMCPGLASSAALPFPSHSQNQSKTWNIFTAFPRGPDGFPRHTPETRGVLTNTFQTVPVEGMLVFHPPKMISRIEIFTLTVSWPPVLVLRWGLANDSAPQNQATESGGKVTTQLVPYFPAGSKVHRW